MAEARAKELNVREHLGTPTDLKPEATRDISAALSALLADTFALYLKTKNFHWHMSGPHFRDYHLLLDEHGDQIFAMTDPIAERARKIGGTTIRSIGHIARQQRIKDNDADYVEPRDMLAELRGDNQQLVTAAGVEGGVDGLPGLAVVMRVLLSQPLTRRTAIVQGMRMAKLAANTPRCNGASALNPETCIVHPAGKLFLELGNRLMGTWNWGLERVSGAQAGCRSRHRRCCDAGRKKAAVLRASKPSILPHRDYTPCATHRDDSLGSMLQVAARVCWLLRRSAIKRRKAVRKRLSCRFCAVR